MDRVDDTWRRVWSTDTIRACRLLPDLAQRHLIIQMNKRRASRRAESEKAFLKNPSNSRARRAEDVWTQEGRQRTWLP